MPIKVLVVDDEPHVRRGLRLRLAREADIAVVGEAETGQAALELAGTLLPDVILLDVRLPDTDGLSLIPALRCKAPICRVIVLSLYDDSRTRARAQSLGVASFPGKHEPVELVVSAVRAAASG